MIDFERALYVVIEQLAKGPPPFPLDHGFDVAAAYRVLGIYNPSESGECWLILSNDDNHLAAPRAYSFVSAEFIGPAHDPRYRHRSTPLAESGGRLTTMRPRGDSIFFKEIDHEQSEDNQPLS